MCPPNPNRTILDFIHQLLNFVYLNVWHSNSLVLVMKSTINFKFDSGVEYLNEEYCLDFRVVRIFFPCWKNP